MRFATISLVSFLLVSFPFGSRAADEPTPEQKKRIEELKKQIAEKKAELEKLEAELAKLIPKPKLTPINLQTAKEGAIGYLSLTEKDAAAVVVDSVIDENHFIANVLFARGEGRFIIKVPTKGFADKQHRKEMTTQIFKVTGTKKIAGETLWVLEPYEEKK